ncbi:MAG: AIR synthase related protein [Candidatus Parcubacteria bacterium]|nr:AIR synthase related protein [Candidatus Parcubacteria bacterium]
MEGQKGMTYQGTGVNYDDMDPFKRLAQKAGLETAINIRHLNMTEFTPSRGESAYLVDCGDYFLAQVVEGLGTKNLVAEAMQRLTGELHFDKIAQCCMAMIVNDLITVGALPISAAMYLAVGDSAWFKDEERAKSLIDGWKHACNLSSCTWGGGETPTLKGIINPDTIDLSGAAMGIIRNKQHLITGGKIKHGDVIIIFASSGIHANGLTLARKIAEKLPQGYLTPIDHTGQTYGRALLEPTEIYVPIIQDCQQWDVDIHYAVNITGHGWRKLMRSQEPFVYVIESVLDPQPVFQIMQKHGPVDDEEAYGNLNMGAGFAIFVSQKDVEVVADIAKATNIPIIATGHIEKRGGEKKVIIEPKGITFEGESLQVR